MSNDKLGMMRLELSVQEMRHHVIHTLVEHQGEIQKMVDEEVRHLIESGALALQIKAAVRRHLDTAIDDGVRRAITSWTRESPTVATAIERAVHEALWQTEEP